MLSYQQIDLLPLQNINNITHNWCLRPQRSWNMEGEVGPLRKIFNLPKVNKAFYNNWDFYKSANSFGLHYSREKKIQVTS